MTDKISCLPILQLTDGPLFPSGPGTLSSLTNMDINPEGYCEARGGFDELKPSGGTGADAISQGGYSDAIQMSTSYGWIRSFDSAAAVNSQYSKNLVLHEGGWLPFPTGIVNDALYFGNDLPFSKVGISAVRVAAVFLSITLVYEYWNGAVWSALTLGAAPLNGLNFGSGSPSYAGYNMPTDWVTNTVGDSGTGNVIKYWMRCRISAVNTLTTAPRVQQAFVYGSGSRELYVATQDPRTGVLSGSLKRHGQSGTTEQWFSISSALYSANASPSRLAEYRGRIIMVNGHDTKRWDGQNFDNLGIKLFANTITLTPAALAAGMGAGIWRYYAAWGQGPCALTGVELDRQDVLALYGPGQAVYLGEVTTTAGVNERVSLALTAAPPAGVSSVYIYKTDNLANIGAAERGYAPAFLIHSKRIDITANKFENNFGNGTAYLDDSKSKVFPQQEAMAYDIAPPSFCKYLLIYQNRLLLGDDEYWYISDPFSPDRFSTKSTTGFIRLARAQGGRHMGGVEFGDQAVLFTEDQTWGLTNVDLDAYQLFPIALGVGCVAPDSIVVVDGKLIWLARDGFYSWDGSRSEPKKISGKMDNTFKFMSFENHGGSKATGHNRRYDIRLSDPQYSNQGAAYRYSLDSGEWSTLFPAGMQSVLYPLTTIYAPLGNADAGVVHPLWGKADYTTSAGTYSLFLGELTTTDNGTGYNCSAWMHFRQEAGELFSPSRILAYYQAANGWGTPVFGFVPTDVIGSSVGTINAGAPDTGTDYSVIGGTFSQVGRGTSDIKISFSVTTAAGGTVNTQRLFGAIVEGKKSGIRRGGI